MFQALLVNKVVDTAVLEVSPLPIRLQIGY